jgi:ribulose-bisphosphate carboxylase large chain
MEVHLLVGRLDLREQRALFSTRGGVDPEDHLIVHFRMTPEDGFSLEEAAARISIIVSLRTLGALPYETREGRLEEGGKILSVQKTGEVTIAFPISQCADGEGIAHLLTLIASGAEYAYTKDFWVDDLELPKRFLDRFQGPKFGAPGMRIKFGVARRAMVGVVLKPRRGASLADVEKAAFECLVGGADAIVDDLLMIDPPGEMGFQNRIPRLAEIARQAASRAKEPKHYIANVSTSAVRAMGMADFAQQHGVSALTINAFTMGFSSSQDFICRPELAIPVITCNMGCGILTRPAAISHHVTTGISEVVITKICRMIGTDGIHAGTSDSECYGQDAWGPSVLALGAKLHHLLPCCAVAEGDLNVADIWANVLSLGPDVLLEPTSGVLGYPGGPRKGAAAFRSIVEALNADMTSEEATEVIVKLCHNDSNVRVGMDHYGFDPDKTH